MSPMSLIGVLIVLIVIIAVFTSLIYLKFEFNEINLYN